MFLFLFLLFLFLMVSVCPAWRGVLFCGLWTVDWITQLLFCSRLSVVFMLGLIREPPHKLGLFSNQREPAR